MELYDASNQWASRPDDERFGTLEDLRDATGRFKDCARVAEVPYRDLTFEGVGWESQDLCLLGPSKSPAVLTHWSFGQLARTVSAPADYLRSLPVDMAARCLAQGLRRKEGVVNLLLHRNGSLVVRSATTDRYSRIWDTDVAERLIPFQDAGWRVPPARPCGAGQAGARTATEQDVLDSRRHGDGCPVQVGDLIAPAGLYASDHDLFVFLVNEDRRLRDGTPGGLSRGFFLSNSEVGAGALKVTTFLYRSVCGNHIVWGAREKTELRIVHRGEANARFARELSLEVRRYADQSSQDDEQTIVRAQRLSLGTDKDRVVDALFTHLRGEAPRKTLGVAYDRAARDRDTDATLDPNTVWGMAQGLTAHSQSLPYADVRAQLDRTAGKVLQMAF